MPITSNATANMSRRQSFNGKGLTFIEMMFDDEVTTTATTPDTKGSVFQDMSTLVGTFGTILAQSYTLAAKATEKDAAAAASIIEDELCDYYTFIVEGTPGQFNKADSTGDINLDPGQNETSDPGVIADAEADIEAEILDRISGSSDSAGGVHVDVRFLPADGVVSTGVDEVYGVNSARVNA
jgi:hypothetical protein|tara:strand:+ start:386 stop:931 length:546 start_codon:yes stop_codon:yes gene_type:complete